MLFFCYLWCNLVSFSIVYSFVLEMQDWSICIFFVVLKKIIYKIPVSSLSAYSIRVRHSSLFPSGLEPVVSIPSSLWPGAVSYMSSRLHLSYGVLWFFCVTHFYVGYFSLTDPEG